MNLLRIYGATLLIALTVGMSACKNDETPATTSTTSEETSNGQKITFDVDIEGLPSDDLRTIIQENIVNGKHAGLKLVWNPGDKETLYLAFKRADAPGGALTVLKSSLTIIKKEGKRYKASVDVNAPVWLNPAKEKVIIAGAIGVSGIDATGGALVPGPRSFYDSGDPYTPPMYFAPTQLHVRTNPGTREREYYADDLTFHFFGSMIGATIDNMQGNMTYSPHEVTIKTDAFSTEGLSSSSTMRRTATITLPPSGRRLRMLVRHSVCTSSRAMSSEERSIHTTSGLCLHSSVVVVRC